MHVTSPLGHNVNVNRVYRNCPIVIQDKKISADLISLPFQEFDLILGMDWLSKHNVTSRPKRVYGMCNRMCTKGFFNYFSAIIEFLKVVLRVKL